MQVDMEETSGKNKKFCIHNNISSGKNGKEKNLFAKSVIKTVLFNINKIFVTFEKKNTGSTISSPNIRKMIMQKKNHINYSFYFICFLAI